MATLYADLAAAQAAAEASSLVKYTGANTDYGYLVVNGVNRAILDYPPLGAGYGVNNPFRPSLTTLIAGEGSTLATVETPYNPASTNAASHTVVAEGIAASVKATQALLEATVDGTELNVTLDDSTRYGDFRKTSSDITASIAFDPLGGFYVPFSGTSGNVGGFIRKSGVVNARFFGASPDATDAENAAAMQSAINFASNTGKYTVHVDDGEFNITKLYFYYDATNNPGYSQTRNGRLGFKGAGTLSTSGIKGTVVEEYGTTLISSETTDHVLHIAKDDLTPYPQRNVRLEAFTVFSASSGFAINSPSCPQFRIKDVSIQLTNPIGSGVRATTSWFLNITELRVFTKTGITATAGTALRIGNQIFGGILEISDCLFDSCWNLVTDDPSDTISAPVTFYNCAFQSSKSTAVYLRSPLSVAFKTVYFEYNVGHDIHMTSTGAKLEVDGGFVLGGSATVATKALSNIHVDGPTSYSVKNLYVYRPWQPLVESTRNASNAITGEVEGVRFGGDNAANVTPTLYLVKSNNATDFPHIRNVYEGSFGSNIKLYDDTARQPPSHARQGVLESGVRSYGKPYRYTGAGTTTYWHTMPSPYRGYVICLNTVAEAFVVPAVTAVADGRSFLFENDPASVSYVNIKLDTTTIKVVNPGEIVEVIADHVGNRWVFR